MRWDELFTDLEAQAAALTSAERGAEIEERTRIEATQLGLIDRLRPAVGTSITVRCRGGLLVSGSVGQVNVEWLLIAEDSGREALIPTTAIVSVAGLSRLSAVPNTMTAVQSRLGLRHALRGVSRDRSAVRIFLTDSILIDGTLDRVGADFVEVALHAAGELRRHSEVRAVIVVSIAEIIAVRRDDSA